MKEFVEFIAKHLVDKPEEVEVTEGVTACWTRMGHILGAASISLSLAGKVINFSGDIG